MKKRQSVAWMKLRGCRHLLIAELLRQGRGQVARNWYPKLELQPQEDVLFIYDMKNNEAEEFAVCIYQALIWLGVNCQMPQKEKRNLAADCPNCVLVLTPDVFHSAQVQDDLQFASDKTIVLLHPIVTPQNKTK